MARLVKDGMVRFKTKQDIINQYLSHGWIIEREPVEERPTADRMTLKEKLLNLFGK